MPLRRESVDGFRAAVAAIIAVLPPIIDPSAPREELGVVGGGMDRLGTLLDDVFAQERKDYARLRDLSERRRLPRAERLEAEACISRLLDAERAGDLAREWWTANRQPLRALFARMGSDDAVAAQLSELPAPLSADRYELRAWLRRAQDQVHGTWHQRMTWYLAGHLAAVLRRTATAIRKWVATHSADHSDESS